MTHDSLDELVQRLDKLVAQQQDFLKLPFYIGFNPTSARINKRLTQSSQPSPIEVARGGSSLDHGRRPHISPLDDAIEQEPAPADSFCRSLNTFNPRYDSSTHLSGIDHCRPTNTSARQPQSARAPASVAAAAPTAPDARLMRASTWANVQPFDAHSPSTPPPPYVRSQPPPRTRAQLPSLHQPSYRAPLSSHQASYSLPLLSKRISAEEDIARRLKKARASCKEAFVELNLRTESKLRRRRYLDS